MAYHEKTTSKDIARLMVSLGLFVFSVGIFSYLMMRFGVNPMARKHSVSMNELFATNSKPSSPTMAPEKGQVAGVETKAEKKPHFEVETVDISSEKKTDRSLEFVRAENAALVRYQKNIYGSQVATEPKLVELPYADFYPWKVLVNTPEDVGGINSLFSFFSTSDTSNVAFVLQWAKNRVGDGTHYDVYVYNAYQHSNPLRKVHSFVEKNGESSVAKIQNMSQDGRYLALSLFTCSTCLKDTPVTMIIDTNTGTYKSLGKTAELVWGQNGQYQYKELKEVDCPDKTIQSKCALDPQFLEYKTGQL
jgi:hypothetical protein